MASAPSFNLQGVKDPILRENLELLQEFLRAQSPLIGFRHFEIKFEKAESNRKFQHGLGSLPQDIILTSSKGAGVVTFNYDKFSTSELDLTVTDACTIRFFAGTYNSKP